MPLTGRLFIISGIDKNISLVYNAVMDAKDARARIMEAATRLLAERGAQETSTRAICEAAGVTQPTLYHHFGDKEGLIEAVVTEGFERALARKKAEERETGDPIEDLRRGWDDHVAFGVENPYLYAVMHGKLGAGRLPRAAEEAGSMLRSLTRGIARAGQLRVEPELAAQAIWAAVYGVTSMLSSQPDFGWHVALSVTMREAVISAIALPEREDRSGGQVAGPEKASTEALRLLGLLETDDGEGGSEEVLRTFSEAEAALLKEWLGRLSRAAAQPPDVRSEEYDMDEEK